MRRMLPNFSWIERDRVAGMAMPAPNAWAAILESGIQAVLSLTERPVGGDPAQHGVIVLHVPLIDFGTPSMDDLRRAVEWIDEQLAADRAVAVHCMAGQGRTGTVLAAWLVAQGQSADEAIRTVRKLRPGSVETHGQVRAIQQFETER